MMRPMDEAERERKRAMLLAQMSALSVGEPKPDPSRFRQPAPQPPPQLPATMPSGLATLFGAASAPTLQPQPQPPPISLATSPARKMAAAELMAKLGAGGGRGPPPQPPVQPPPHPHQSNAPFYSPPMPTTNYGSAFAFPPVAQPAPRPTVPSNGIFGRVQPPSAPVPIVAPSAPTVAPYTLQPSYNGQLVTSHPHAPPLQPTPRRPIGLLNMPSPPPGRTVLPTVGAPPAQSASLLSLLTGAGAP